MALIKTDLNLSTRKTNKLTENLRVATRKRKLFEPNLKDYITQRHRSLDHLFEVIDVEFGEVQPTVVCTDIDSLIRTISDERQQFDTELAFKIGIDGGGGYLKFCLNSINPEEMFITQSNLRSTYNCGVASKAMKSTGVNKLQIIGLAPDVPETYDNVLQLWSMLDINQLFKEKENVRVAADLKLCNIIIGLMSHSCNHPCSWCNIER